MSPAAGVFLFSIYLGVPNSEVPIAGPFDGVECRRVAAEHNKEIRQVAYVDARNLPTWYCGEILGGAK